ncbi:hypothetical protein DTW90_31820 [Neorhizobium sp. P12A]|nr:hypothetical protein DTW90_31820 [Neorhizobium sp. P12A]
MMPAVRRAYQLGDGHWDLCRGSRLYESQSKKQCIPKGQRVANEEMNMPVKFETWRVNVWNVAIIVGGIAVNGAWAG